MWYKGKASEADEFRYGPDIVQDHHDKMTNLLDEHGYIALVRMSERIENRRSEMESKLEKKEVQLECIDIQKQAYRDKYSEVRHTTEGAKAPLQTPIGKAWLDEKGQITLSEESPWDISQMDDELQGGSLANLRVSYSPDETFNAKLSAELLISTSDFELENAFSSVRLEPSGDRMWGIVFDELEDLRKMREKRRDKLRRTRDLFRFRYAVAELVLYQFEAFGDTEEMSDEIARKMISEQLPDIFEKDSKPLEYAMEVQEIYEDGWDPSPETMKDLKAKMGQKGESKITRLQTEIREAGLSDKWENGNPDSFCSLVVNLVERHYGI